MSADKPEQSKPEFTTDDFIAAIRREERRKVAGMLRQLIRYRATLFVGFHDGLEYSSNSEAVFAHDLDTIAKKLEGE